MSDLPANAFDNAAANWDAEPRRIELAKTIGQAVLDQVHPTAEMDVLDYGCGTGLLGLFLLPHVRSVTGADSSPGMLTVLAEKIRTGCLQHMQAMQLDLGLGAVPESRYHLITANMVLHHVQNTDRLLAAFHTMLHPGGFVAIADLDTEPNVFHGPEAAESVFHYGFDRGTLQDRLRRVGFTTTSAITAHVIHKPIADGSLRAFPIFLITAQRS